MKKVLLVLGLGLAMFSCNKENVKFTPPTDAVVISEKSNTFTPPTDAVVISEKRSYSFGGGGFGGGGSGGSW